MRKGRNIDSLKNALQQGDDRAAMLLYYFYYSSGDDCCMQYLEMAVNKGNITARYEYAIHQLEGDYIPNDTESALQSLEYCANHGHIEAIDQLSYMYTIGYKVKTNPEQAKYWQERKGDSDFDTDQENISIRIEISKPMPEVPVEEIPIQETEENDTESVLEIISKVIDISEVTTRQLTELRSGRNMQIVLSNIGEKSFVFSQLLNPKASLGKSGLDENISIRTIDECKIVSENSVNVFSGSVIDNITSRKMLGKLLEKSNLKQAIRLDLRGRDFYIMDSSQEDKDRWACRNDFCSTHLMLLTNDVTLDTEIDDYSQVSFYEDEEDGGYYIVSKSTNEIIGHDSSSLEQALEHLMAKNEISSKPRMINGIELSNCNGSVVVNGMGHMEFGLDD